MRMGDECRESVAFVDQGEEGGWGEGVSDQGAWYAKNPEAETQKNLLGGCPDVIVYKEGEGNGVRGTSLRGMDAPPCTECKKRGAKTLDKNKFKTRSRDPGRG